MDADDGAGPRVAGRVDGRGLRADPRVAAVARHPAVRGRLALAFAQHYTTTTTTTTATTTSTTRSWSTTQPYATVKKNAAVTDVTDEAYRCCATKKNKQTNTKDINENRNHRWRMKKKTTKQNNERRGQRTGFVALGDGVVVEHVVELVGRLAQHLVGAVAQQLRDPESDQTIKQKMNK